MLVALADLNRPGFAIRRGAVYDRDMLKFVVVDQAVRRNHERRRSCCAVDPDSAVELTFGPVVERVVIADIGVRLRRRAVLGLIEPPDFVVIAHSEAVGLAVFGVAQVIVEKVDDVRLQLLQRAVVKPEIPLCRPHGEARSCNQAVGRQQTIVIANAVEAVNVGRSEVAPDVNLVLAENQNLVHNLRDCEQRPDASQSQRSCLIGRRRRPVRVVFRSRPLHQTRSPVAADTENDPLVCDDDVLHVFWRSRNGHRSRVARNPLVQVAVSPELRQKVLAPKSEIPRRDRRRQRAFCCARGAVSSASVGVSTVAVV